MRRLLWAFPVAFFFLNPNLACSPGEPEFQYGATEMRAAVEGDWAFTLTPSSGAPVEVTVHVEQAASLVSSRVPTRGGTLVRSAQACGTRTLIKGAEACLDATQMPLTVAYVAGDPSFATPGSRLSGGFTAIGLTFTGGFLTLTLGPYDGIEVDVDADGSIRGARSSTSGLAGVDVTRP